MSLRIGVDIGETFPDLIAYDDISGDVAPRDLIRIEVRSGPSRGHERSRFFEEQIIGILKEHEAGISVADLCRKHGVSDASIYNWKAHFGGMDVSEARRLMPLKHEND